MDKRKEVHEALGNWIIHVTDKKGTATSNEIAALPKVAEVFFDSYSVSFSQSTVLLDGKEISRSVESRD